MSAADQSPKSPPPDPGGDEDIIELTEVVEDRDSEVVLDLGANADAAVPRAWAPSPEDKPAASAGGEESLDDLLASLNNLPDDLDMLTEAPPLEIQGRGSLGQELAARLPEAELRDLVREVIQETVARLARELLPELAAAAVDREIERLKMRLLEPD